MICQYRINKEQNSISCFCIFCKIFIPQSKFSRTYQTDVRAIYETSRVLQIMLLANDLRLSLTYVDQPGVSKTLSLNYVGLWQQPKSSFFLTDTPNFLGEDYNLFHIISFLFMSSFMSNGLITILLTSNRIDQYLTHIVQCRACLSTECQEWVTLTE